MKKKFGTALCVMSVFCVMMVLIVSCTKKKDRLVADTLAIGITPTSVSVSTNTAINLTAVCKSASSNNANISPTWTVDPAALGSFSAKQGKTTTFTSTALTSAAGKGKIYATYSNIKASANVSVSSSTVSTITLGSITLSPVAVSTGAAHVITAVCKDTTGNVVSVTPNWSVNATTLGTFSASHGTSVTFTGNPLAKYAGSGTITAAYYGVSGSASVVVSSNAANATIYGLYSSIYVTDGYTHINMDTPNPPDPNGGALGWYSFDTGLTFTTNGTDPVSNTPAALLTDGTWGGNGGDGGWYIQFGSDGSQGSGAKVSTDMSRFAGGSLKFDAVVDYGLRIEIDTYNGYQYWCDNTTAWHTPDWYTFEVPLSCFLRDGTGASITADPNNLKQIVIPAEFESRGDGDPNFAIGNVRWDEASSGATPTVTDTGYANTFGLQ